jgi:ABC-type Fe3+-hydroxamate transport system substrate-binding protein
MINKLLLDQLERKVDLPIYPPMRIVSLVPSQTELLADLGLADRVVGITKFCVHPSSWRKEKTIIGGTKQLHLDRIRQLKPDLIIANQEENDREQVETLALEFPVWVSKVVDLPTALEMITGVGESTGTRTLAEDLALRINASFADLKQFPIRSCAYLIWRKPFMVSGGDTFIQAMLEAAGFQNVFGHQDRYPEVSLEELAAADPEWILLSSEPFPFREKHVEELSAVCPNAEVRLVDGEMFSWYGSRLLRSADYFRTLREAE